MKRIKKFYREHRVFTILMAIVLVCMIIIATVLIQCFYVGNTDKYGNRLDGIENHVIEESTKSDYEANLANNPKVRNAKIMVTGRIVYITINFESNCSLTEAESIAAKSLESFSEDIHSFYDFNLTLKKAASVKDNQTILEGFIISGAKNKNGSGLVWNNNLEVKSDSGV